MVNIHAKYTIVLKTLMDDPEVMSKIDEAMSTYELYEPKKVEREFIPNYIPTRSELNKKILNHYKYREIGFETIGRFLDELQIALEEIMPYYNQLMFTQDQDFNIIYNVDYTRTIESHKAGEHASKTEGEHSSSTDGEHSSNMQGTASGTIKDTGTTKTDGETTDTSQSSTSMDSANKHVKSDTPQDELSITAKNIDTVNYASEVSWNKDGSTSTSSGSGSATNSSETESTMNRTTSDTNNVDTSGTDNTTTSGTESVDRSGTNSETENTNERVLGNYGQVSAQRLIATYRETIINIEQMIINDKRISELFMLVW